jgi:hypothetical protein
MLVLPRQAEGPTSAGQLHTLNVAGARGPPVAYGEQQGNEIKFEASAEQRSAQWQAVTDLVPTRAK